MGWLRRLFGWDVNGGSQNLSAVAVSSGYANLAIRELAYEMCVKRIAKTFCKCEFRTYRRYKEEKGSLYYNLNISPNYNQNGAEFWEKVITKLYLDGEVLIIPETLAGGLSLYVADTFSVKNDDATIPYVFDSITIKDKPYGRALKADEVYYIRLQNDRMRILLDNTLAIYTDLIKASVDSFKKSNGAKYKIKVDQNREADDETLEEILNEDMQTFLKSDNAVIPEYEGYEIVKLDQSGTISNTRDFKALLDDVVEITCKALFVPYNISRGDVADTSKAVSDFLTFCLDTLIEIIQDEINRKTFKPGDYLKGDYIKIDTSHLRHIDVVESANNLDKLIASGVKTPNDIYRLLGDPQINEEWANTHYITKNYTTTSELKQTNEVKNE